MLDPGNSLPLLDRAVEDTQQSKTAEERRGVEVRDPGLKGVLVVVQRSRNVLEDGVEQRLEVFVVGERTVLRLVPACSASTARSVDNRNVKDGVQVKVGNVIRHVAGKTEQEVLAFADDLVNTCVGTVGLVDQQDDGKLGLKSLTEHEAGLRKRALTRVNEQNNTVNHAESALDLATEVGVAGSVDHVDRDGAVSGVLAVVRDRGVLRENRNSLFTLKLVRVHRTLFKVRVRLE